MAKDNYEHSCVKYTLVEKADSLLYAVRIDEGEFRGTIYTYGKVSIKPNPDSSLPPVLNFVYVINRAGQPYTIAELNSLPSFKNTIGDILVNIIETNSNHANRTTGSDLKKSRPK